MARLQISATDRPNVIQIITHDTGKALSCYGSAFQTPNIDKFAAKGVKFVNHFATAPQCTPSRGSILTGKYPHNNGLMGLTNLGWNLPKSNLTLPQILSQNGYSTHLIGLQHTHAHAEELGYQNISPRRDFPYFASTVRRRFKKFIQNIESIENSQPFYCSVGFFETHRPFDEPTEEELTEITKVHIPPYLPDDPVIRKELAGFYHHLKNMDKQFGKIIKMIDESKIADNTIIFFTVDHGWAFPRAKCTLYDPGIATPLIMYWKNKVEGGKEYEQLISNVDLFPTLLHLLDIKIPPEIQDNLDGQSFAGLFNNELYTPRQAIFAEMTFHDQGYNPMRAIRTHRWKYIANFTNFRNLRFQIPNDIISEAESGMKYIKIHPDFKNARPREELYDLYEDPEEMHNLVNDVKYYRVKSKLKVTLMEKLRKSNDPVLNGTPEAPEEPSFFIF